jgi:hypothetical protein
VLAGTPILVSVALGEHFAGVRRDAQEGHLWIAHWMADRPERVAGTRLEGADPASIGIPGWWAVGGRLPARVASVDARGDSGTWHPAAVGESAWVVFVDGPENSAGLPPIRMLDARGELVSRAPEGPSRELTAQQAQLLAMSPGGLGGVCPVCATEDWRAAPFGIAERIFCARCGHTNGAAHGFWAPG